MYLLRGPRIPMKHHHQSTAWLKHIGHINYKLTPLTIYYDGMFSCFPGFSFCRAKYLVGVVSIRVVILRWVLYLVQGLAFAHLIKFFVVV